MRVVEGDAAMCLFEPCDLGGERGVIRLEIGAAAFGDLGGVRRRAGLVERLAVVA